jgi:hypothetical protein
MIMTEVEATENTNSQLPYEPAVVKRYVQRSAFGVWR